MQMIFVTLFPDTHVDKKQTEALGTTWASMLKTGGIHLSVYPMNANQLLLSQEDGRTLEVKEFLLSQPEVEKVRWKDKDWTPEEHHLAKRKANRKAARKAKRKVKLNAGKAKATPKPARKRVEL
ncbi:unnamed protein product [Symbiodinium sp. KB8]|nr:unnamed protein product [Symbiodinium sp. KB8]